MAFDIIVIGSVSLDVLAKTDAKIVQIKGLSHGQMRDEKWLAYPLGSKLLIRKLAFSPGGAGTNACATFAKFDFNTAFIGMIGMDIHGQILLNWFRENGITFLGKLGNETGYSLILTSQADDRTILSFKGCNDDLELAVLPLSELQASWLYGTSMLGKSFATQEKLFLFAKHTGMQTAYNPNPYICSKGLPYLRRMLQHTDVLILNHEEASLLAGTGTPLELAQRLASHGPDIVTVSDGAKGATIFTNQTRGGEKWHITPARGLSIVETTGAGDAFGAGFVAGLKLQKTIREAALMGVLNAEEVIQTYGATQHIASRQEMEVWLSAERDQPRHDIIKL
jgi:ribokinase